MRFSPGYLQLLGAAAAVAAAAPSANSSESLGDCIRNALSASDPDSRIVWLENGTYTDARLGEKIQFDELPAVIAYTDNISEVAPLVQCAREAGIQPVARSGGHHFLAYSSLNNSLVIDMAHLNFVNVSSDKKTASVGAGIRLGALYMALEKENVTWVGGICPTVGLAGLVSAGGFNMQMREMGLSVNYVVSATVVLANGTTVVASPSSHPDLFWAIRGGGGGTYGIVVEMTLKLVTYPRFAVMYASWTTNGTADPTAFEVAKRFLQWAPALPKEITSQINIYRRSVEVVGIHMGGTQLGLQQQLNASGLAAIGSPTVGVYGGCGTNNMRVFGYTEFECVADDQVKRQILNVVPDPFSQFDDYPQFSWDEQPQSSSVAEAEPWSRFRRMSKSFFLLKDRPLADDVLRKVIDMISQMDVASDVWAEWHAWNLTGAPSADSAFAWTNEAIAHLEFQVHGSNNTATDTTYSNWFDDLEKTLRPAVGNASYSGYMDSGISVDHLTAYYGDNVCRLIEVKKAYDPENIFTNPYAIPVEAPANISC